MIDELWVGEQIEQIELEIGRDLVSRHFDGTADSLKTRRERAR